MTITHLGQVKEGKLLLDDKGSFTGHLHTLEGKRVEVTVRKFRKKRTVDQNRYYFLILGMIAKETGHDAMSLHEAFKAKFSTHITYKGLVISESTKNKDTVEFTNYIEQVRAWAAEHLNMVIPDAQKAGI
jgi:hypothetical protein